MNTEEFPYIEKARAELQNPTFALTQQYLEVLEVEHESGIPKAARVDLNSSESIVSVWFPVKNERFYLVVSLTKLPEADVHFVRIESGNRVYLTATSEDLSQAEIAALTQLELLEGWSKSDQQLNNYIAPFSRISYEPIKSEAYELEEKLKLLLDELEKDAEGVRQLAAKATAYVAVCRHQYVSGNAGIHLDFETLCRLSELKLALDIDTYIVENPLNTKPPTKKSEI